MNSKWHIFRKCILMVGLAFFVFPSAPSSAVSKVRLILNWIPEGHHAGYFAARDKGFYSQEGLDVDIISGKGSGFAVKRVGVGDAEVGLADSGAVVVGRSQGVKVRMVGIIFDRSPLIIFYLKSSGIRGPKDLRGHTLACPVGSAPRVVFPAFASSAGIPADSVKWLTVPAAAQIPTLLTKKADGIPTIATRRVAYQRAAAKEGLEIGELLYADHGFNMYGMALISNDKWIQSNAANLRKFLKATYQGIRWSMDNTSESIDLLLKSHPTMDRELNLGSWEVARGLMISPVTKRHGLGHMVQERVKITRDLITKFQNVKTPAAVEDLYTNDYLPEIFPPK